MCKTLPPGRYGHTPPTHTLFPSNNFGPKTPARPAGLPIPMISVGYAGRPFCSRQTLSAPFVQFCAGTRPPPSAAIAGRVMVQLARLPLREGCVMNSPRRRRDPRTGRVFGFQSETQRDNFMLGRARFCNGPNREMPRCSALNRLGEPCKAARMRGRSTCFRHSGNAAAKRARLAAAHLSGDVDRIQRAEMRAERNRLRSLWRRDPREPGRTIMLTSSDEATCRAWAARQGIQLDVLDRDLPGVRRCDADGLGRACRAVWSATTTWSLSSPDCAIGSWRRAVHSIIRDDHGRLVPVVRPKVWRAASVKRSRDRADCIARARKQRKTRLATTLWMNELDRRGIAELEATGIPWAASNAGSTRWTRARSLWLGWS